jgi:hypothetical protein
MQQQSSIMKGQQHAVEEPDHLLAVSGCNKISSTPCTQ